MSKYQEALDVLKGPLGGKPALRKNDVRKFYFYLNI